MHEKTPDECAAEENYSSKEKLNRLKNTPAEEKDKIRGKKNKRIVIKNKRQVSDEPLAFKISAGGTTMGGMGIFSSISRNFRGKNTAKGVNYEYSIRLCAFQKKNSTDLR